MLDIKHIGIDKFNLGTTSYNAYYVAIQGEAFGTHRIAFNNLVRQNRKCHVVE